MTEQHPITPPPELVQQWLGTYFGTTVTGEVSEVELALATQAARWGADQELEECCEYIAGPGKWFATPQFRLAELRAARRPKPPSLKEQALHILDTHGNLTRAEADTIRRALEALKEQVFHILDAFGNLTRAEADNIRRALEALND